MHQFAAFDGGVSLSLRPIWVIHLLSARRCDLLLRRTAELACSLGSDSHRQIRLLDPNVSPLLLLITHKHHSVTKSVTCQGHGIKITSMCCISVATKNRLWLKNYKTVNCNIIWQWNGLLCADRPLRNNMLTLEHYTESPRIVNSITVRCVRRYGQLENLCFAIFQFASHNNDDISSFFGWNYNKYARKS